LTALWTTHDDLNHHDIRDDRQAFRTLASAAGVDLMSLPYLFHGTGPITLPIRLKARLWQTTPQPPKGPLRLINRMLLALACAELRVAAHLRLPFGSSLLAVAR
ncbi:MAG: hypothetical protein ACK5MO_09665, partial [Planctomyces sp.]